MILKLNQDQLSPLLLYAIRSCPCFVPKNTECYRDVNLILCLHVHVSILTNNHTQFESDWIRTCQEYTNFSFSFLIIDATVALKFDHGHQNWHDSPSSMVVISMQRLKDLINIISEKKLVLDLFAKSENLSDCLSSIQAKVAKAFCVWCCPYTTFDLDRKTIHPLASLHFWYPCDLEVR